MAPNCQAEEARKLAHFVVPSLICAVCLPEGRKEGREPYARGNNTLSQRERERERMKAGLEQRG